MTKLKRQGKAHNAEMRELQRRVPELEFRDQKNPQQTAAGLWFNSYWGATTVCWFTIGHTPGVGTLTPFVFPRSPASAPK